MTATAVAAADGEPGRAPLDDVTAERLAAVVADLDSLEAEFRHNRATVLMMARDILPAGTSIPGVDDHPGLRVRCPHCARAFRIVGEPQ